MNQVYDVIKFYQFIQFYEVFYKVLSVCQMNLCAANFDFLYIPLAPIFCSHKLGVITDTTLVCVFKFHWCTRRKLTGAHDLFLQFIA